MKTNTLFDEGLPQDFAASLSAFEDEDNLEEFIRGSLPARDVLKGDARSLQKLVELVEKLETLEREKGTNKWFDSPYTIDTLPKHKKFFEAGNDYHERLFMAGNR